LKTGVPIVSAVVDERMTNGEQNRLKAHQDVELFAILDQFPL